MYKRQDLRAAQPDLFFDLFEMATHGVEHHPKATQNDRAWGGYVVKGWRGGWHDGLGTGVVTAINVSNWLQT